LKNGRKGALANALRDRHFLGERKGGSKRQKLAKGPSHE
jgi:hypothetical protein